MAQIRETSRIPLGKGCEMSFKVNDALSHNSIDYHWSEVTYDGEPDSWVPVGGKHWHKNHDEYMEVLEGRIEFFLNGKSTMLHAGDAPLHIPKLHVHGFKFIPGVKSRFTEKTNPAGEFKEKFFGVLFSSGEPTLITVGKSFYEGDCFLALPGGWRSLEVNVTWAIGKWANWWSP